MLLGKVILSLQFLTAKLHLDSVAGVFSFSWKGLWPRNTATVVLFVLYKIGTCQEEYKIGHWSSLIQKEKGHKSPPLSDDRRPKYSRNVSLLVKCQMPNVKYQRGCGVKGTAVSSLLPSFSAFFSLWKEVLRQRSSSVRVFTAYCAVKETACCFGPVSGRIILNKSQMNVGGERKKIISNKEGIISWAATVDPMVLKNESRKKAPFLFFNGNFCWKISSDESLVFYLNLQQASKTWEDLQIPCPFWTMWPVVSLAAAGSKSINSEKNTDLARIKCSFWVFPTAVSGLNPGKSFSRVISIQACTKHVEWQCSLIERQKRGEK